MRRHVEQAVLLHLALDLDQRVAQPTQQRHRGRLVVDEGTAAAVAADGTAERQHVLVVQALLRQDGVRRMFARQIEGCGNRGLGRAAPHGSAVGARAQRQPERVDQDGFARTGLASQGTQPAMGTALRVARET